MVDHPTISLMAGEIASLLLSRVTVPILYYMSERGRGRTDEVAPPTEEPALV